MDAYNVYFPFHLKDSYVKTEMLKLLSWRNMALNIEKLLQPGSCIELWYLEVLVQNLTLSMLKASLAYIYVSAVYITCNFEKMHENINNVNKHNIKFRIYPNRYL